jgi:serine/threonine-protein kinase HipA
VAGEVLTHRGDLHAHFHEAGKEKALRDILSVGTSGGGIS